MVGMQPTMGANLDRAHYVVSGTPALVPCKQMPAGNFVVYMGKGSMVPSLASSSTHCCLGYWGMLRERPRKRGRYTMPVLAFDLTISLRGDFKKICSKNPA